MNPETTTQQSPESFLEELSALPEVTFRQLTLSDRCDADVREAAVAQVRMPAGNEILLCGHHWRLNYDALASFPHDVPDELSKPYTERRNQELGAPSQRDAGSAVL